MTTESKIRMGLCAAVMAGTMSVLLLCNNEVGPAVTVPILVLLGIVLALIATCRP